MTAARTPTGCREPARPQAPSRRRPAGRRRSASMQTRRARARRRSDRGSRPAARPAGAARTAASIGGAADLGQAVDQVDDAHLAAGADVPQARDPGVARGHERPHDVADVHVVARLQAVAEHRRRLVAHDAAGEDRDDARLAARVLARAVDVAEAQDRVLRRVQPVEQAHVLLGAQLGGAVRRLRLAGGGLGRRPRGVRAVDGAAGGGEHHPRADVERGLQHVDGARHVDRGVGGRVGHRQAHVGLGGEVPDHVGPVLGEGGLEGRGVADVDGGERRLDPVALALGEVVDGEHVVAAGGERVDQVRADEARAAGDDRPHQCPTTTSTTAGASSSGADAVERPHAQGGVHLEVRGHALGGGGVARRVEDPGALQAALRQPVRLRGLGRVAELREADLEPVRGAVDRRGVPHGHRGRRGGGCAGDVDLRGGGLRGRSARGPAWSPGRRCRRRLPAAAIARTIQYARPRATRAVRATRKAPVSSRMTWSGCDTRS